jgi:hypothetical protein
VIRFFGSGDEAKRRIVTESKLQHIATARLEN